MRRTLLPVSLLLAASLVLAGGRSSPPSTLARPLWTVTVDQSSGIESAGYFGVFTVQQGRAVALDHLTGRVKWRSASNDIGGLPFQRQPYVFFPRRDGGVRALDFFSGKERWAVGGKGSAQLSQGPTLGSSQGTVLVADQQSVRVLDQPTGRVLWQVGALSPEHNLSVVNIHTVLLLLHSPSEGFLGNVYTAHDPATGRELWRLKAGHGYLLGETQGGLIFDLRDWHNVLGEGGTVQAVQNDRQTGRRSPLILKVGVPNAREWQIEPGSLQFAGQSGTWAIAVRSKDGAPRLIYTPAKGQTHFWTLPGKLQVGSGTSLYQTTAGVLVGLPDGKVLLIDPAKGTQRIILASGGSAADISERLSGVRAIIRGDQTVFLDDDERIRLRVAGRADAWTIGGDLQNVMVLKGQQLGSYTWPSFSAPKP